MDNQDNGLEKICNWCKKPKSADYEWEKHQKYIQDVVNAFSYYVGGEEVTHEEYKNITSQKEVAQEQLDSIKRKNSWWKRLFPGIKRPF